MPEGTSERRVAMRFARASQIGSNHVPSYVDVGCLEDGRPYIVMEYLEGVSLNGSRPLGISQSVDYVLQACDAIAAAHAVGLVHRRLTTSTLFHTQKGGSSFVKVLNFTAVKGSSSQADDLASVSFATGSPVGS